jgi:hypothetical protein
MRWPSDNRPLHFKQLEILCTVHGLRNTVTQHT